ncbi:MAG: hypothetical protein PW792_09700 [Acidobacteriaceae bacterium]|nr:hypothetical protein [Acidobacteriaceae bacterium]
MFLLVVGVILLSAAILPVLAMVRVPDTWDIAFTASKLLMLPLGAICLLAAAGIHARFNRQTS